MGSVKLVGFAAIFLVTGCAAQARSSASDRAIALYREILRASSGSSGGANGPSKSPAAMRPGEVPESLTADAAVTLAKNHSARLAFLTAQAEEVAAMVASASAPRNPELRASVQFDQSPEHKAQQRTALRVFVPRPGELDAKVAKARADEAEARAAVRAEEIAIEADVRWLFDDVLLLEAQIAAAEAVATTRKTLAERMKARLEASAATEIDDILAQFSALEADQSQASLVSDLMVSRGELLTRVGIDPSAPVKIVGDAATLWPPPPLPSEQSLVEAALRARPEIQAAAARLDATDARMFAERARRWPWFSFLEVGAQGGPAEPGALGWTLQAGLELPILDTNRAGVATADAALIAARKGLTAEVMRIAGEVRSRLVLAQAAEKLATDLRDRSLPVTTRADAAVRRALEGNDVDIVRALTVDERRVLMELHVVIAIRKYRSAVAELRRSVGGKLPSPDSPPGQR